MATDAEIEELKLRLAQAEAALKDRAAADLFRLETEEKYRNMFDMIDEGFCVIEVIGGGDEPLDYIFLEVNASFERQTGLRCAVGRRMREMEPDHEEHWFQRYSRIAETRAPERFEDRADALGRWYDVYAFAVGDPEQRRVAILFRDVIERKRAEQELLKVNALLRTTFDSSLQIIQLFKAVRNEQDTIVDFEWLLTNKQWNDRWGPRAGRSLLHENPAVVESGVWDRFLKVIETGVPMTHEHYYSHEQFDGWFLQTIAKADDGILLSTLDITDLKRAEVAARESEERFAQFAKASASGLWIRDAEKLEMEFTSPAVSEIYGVHANALLGDVKRWAALIVPEDRETALEHLNQARAGSSVMHEFRIQRPSDSAFRWIKNTDFPLTQDGRITRIGGIAEDVTDAKIAAEHQGILLSELQHRVRNIMAMIRSMVNRSADGPLNVEDYRSLLEGRLMALARVQALLTRHANAGGSLRVVIESEVAAQAHHAGQYVLKGPDVFLSPKAVEVLTLAFHELATNALKYGGLSVSQGQVVVEWEIVEHSDAPWLVLDWTEYEAPKREPPKRRGFGSELIEMKIPYELRGRGRLMIDNGQAHCHVEIPLHNAESILETDAPAPVTIHGGSLDMMNAPDLSSMSILVVEDDYYMASDIMAALRGAGADVLGPCPSEGTTEALLETVTPTSAILDLNLGGGGPRFEIARRLKERGIPFLFLTGYDPDIIPDDMTEILRLQKPVAMLEVVEAISRLPERR
ncbi:PAS domain S-box protein [Rhizobium cauense]|uniref:PAS domain S-box protein n=1 Tax=Rhizobium cauense TaxID=1166683 RepID=UPI001C6F10A7|nr:PAS domain S-box protein [Rhizobium cauense]MBW9117987.1 PAS domain S-box protein [Rhizobium cauense]